MGPTVEHRFNEGPQAIGFEGPAGRVVDGHGVDGIDIDTFGDLRDVIRTRVHSGIGGRQEVRVHALEGHLVHGARKARNRDEDGRGCGDAGPIAVGFGDTDERSLERLVSAVEDKDLGWRCRFVLELETELGLPQTGPRLNHRRVTQRVEVVGQWS